MNPGERQQQILYSVFNFEKENYKYESYEMTSNYNGLTWKKRLNNGTHGDIQSFRALSAVGPENLKIERIYIAIGGEIITDLKGSIFEALNGNSQFNIEKGEHHWLINNNLFYERAMPSVKLLFQSFEIMIEFNVSPQSVQIFIEDGYLDSKNRRELALNDEYKLIIQQINTSELSIYHKPELFKKLPINGLTLCKGLFLETDVNSIEAIIVKFNGVIALNIEQPFLNIYGKKYSNNLFWIPFRQDCEMNCTKDSFLGAHNLRNYIDNTAEITVYWKQPQNKLSIHSLLCNILLFRSGFAQPLFPSENTIIVEPPPPPQPEKFGNVPIRRALDENRTFCAILHDEIIENYAHCETCKHNFDVEGLMHTFKQLKKEECPMCRSAWTDFKVYKVN